MFSQLIIATHSLEIIEEVTSECIIPIDSSKRQIKPIGNESSLQSLTKQLGSPFNIDLARIFISNQFILWDGDDTARKILSAFQSVLYPQDLHPLINLPKSFINGWDDWDKVKMVADLFALNRMNMELFCILNSDYHSQSEIKLRQQEARKHKINLLVWEKKEIENYAINSDVILRYITHNKHQGTIDKDSLDRVIDSILNDMKEDVLTYSSGATNTNVEKLRNDYKQPCDIVSGREFFNILSLWTQGEYGITISARQVIPYFLSEEVPSEIRDVINTIMKDSI
jgi:hypothetical protein